MKTILLGGAAVVALASSNALLAQVTPPPAQPAPHPHMMRMQTELRTDVQAHVAKMFAQLDRNRDGFITKAEADAMQAERAAKAEKHVDRFDPAKMFARLDTNKDGKITQAEVDAAEAARAQAKGGQPKAHDGFFARVDANKDGVVTRAEFDSAAAQMHARMERAGMHRGFAGRMFDTADLNKDGKISLAEAQQMALQHFDRADLNHDGKLTPEERQQSDPGHRGQQKA